MYLAVTNTVTMLFGMGLNSSGVRQIAEANAGGDPANVARAASSLTKTSFIMGGLGALILAAVAEPICRLTFGSADYSRAVALVSVTILLAIVANGQIAVVQGMQRVRDLAMINIAPGLAGTLIGVPIIFFFREQGIVPLVMILSLMTIVASTYAVRQVHLETARITWQEFTEDAKVLLRLGLVFMASGVMASATAYLVRVFIVHQLGLEAAGQYQAAWALSGMYVSFIIGAMGTDFYPRLTAVADDRSAYTRLANEQAEIAVLLALPGVLATIALAPVVIAVFYSSRFEPAIQLLQWQMLGVWLKVCAFPIGFIILAKGAGKLFLMTETLTYCVSVGLSWLCLQWFGLVGAGVAFFGMYAFCFLIVYWVVWRQFGFQWSASNLRLAAVAMPTVVATFIITLELPPVPATLLGGAISAIAGVLCLKRVLVLVGTSRLPAPLNGLVRRLGLAPAVDTQRPDDSSVSPITEIVKPDGLEIR
jgi:antigen flippase